MTKKEFKKLLEEHDWYYQMSDDQRVWTTGNKQRIEIEALCRDNPVFNDIYIKEGKKIFSNKNNKIIVYEKKLSTEDWNSKRN